MQLDNPVDGQTGLTKAERYRAKAEDCERMATEASGPDIKRWFLRAAEEWRLLAQYNFKLSRPEGRPPEILILSESQRNYVT